jgi:uncharacterized protein
VIDLPMIFLAGLLGASHCVGMCGGFVLTIGGATRTWNGNLARQLVYTAGRVFTYIVLGATAGFGGWRLKQWSATIVNIPALLALAAGALLAYQGLLAAGVLRRRGVPARHRPCLAGSFFASFLTNPTHPNVFLAGLFTGLLPCGLLYGMLALAASRDNLLAGALTMGVFGLGTAPIMLATGCGASLLSLTTRHKMFQAAAWCLFGTGVISLVRGCYFLWQFGDNSGGCPWCL